MMRLIWILVAIVIVSIGIEKGYKYVRDPNLIRLQRFDKWALPHVEELRKQTNDRVNAVELKLEGKAVLVCLEENASFYRKYRPDIPSTDPLQLKLSETLIPKRENEVSTIFILRYDVISQSGEVTRVGSAMSGVHQRHETLLADACFIDIYDVESQTKLGTGLAVAKKPGRPDLSGIPGPPCDQQILDFIHHIYGLPQSGLSSIQAEEGLWVIKEK